MKSNYIKELSYNFIKTSYICQIIKMNEQLQWFNQCKRDVRIPNLRALTSLKF